MIYCLPAILVRRAQAVIKLQTGGKARPQRQNLIAFHGTATRIFPIKDPPTLGPGTIPEPDGTVAPQNISVYGKTLGSDGNLYLALPDNDEVTVTPMVASADYYTFTLTANNYTPVIAARGNGNNYDDLSVTNPKFCVGQQLTFWMNWNPPTTNIDNIFWHLPDKYVNKATNYSATCTTYVKDDNLLTNATTQCWYVRDPGGACSVRETLHFANGQSVNIAANGNFTVYRPSVNKPDPSGPFHAALLGSVTPTLQLANNPMQFSVTVSSKYSGSFGLTQLVKMYSETIFFPPDLLMGATTWGDFNLDINPDGSTGEYYDGPYVLPHSCQINDAPGQPLIFIMGDYSGNWKDYVRFTPDGGIPITLERIDWNWAATAFDDQASWWTITSDGEDGPTPHADDSFPLWKSEGITQFPIP